MSVVEYKSTSIDWSSAQDTAAANASGVAYGHQGAYNRRQRILHPVRRQGDIMTVKRMDNVGIVVEDLDAAIEFFTELGLELEGRAPIEGAWADGVTGLRDMRVEIAMMRTPDGHSRLELSRFLAPPVVADHRSAPVNAFG